jgi:hypothetical protein
VLSREVARRIADKAATNRAEQIKVVRDNYLLEYWAIRDVFQVLNNRILVLVIEGIISRI